MLQSCLRVSYTSPKSMHWITDLLEFLLSSNDVLELKTKTEKIAKNAVLPFVNDGDYSKGVNTPHIVFNYLDYLLWKQQKNVDFSFEFRNSVEHWQPQNPIEKEHEGWVDYFGNLCIIQRNINSKFSNLDPVSKQASFSEMIKKGSLKLRLMSEITKNSDVWNEEKAKEHGQKMIELLMS